VLIVDLNWRIGYVNGPAWAQFAEVRDVVGMTLSKGFPDAADTENSVAASSGICDSKSQGC
jgi:hypothetical protein